MNTKEGLARTSSAADLHAVYAHYFVAMDSSCHRPASHVRRHQNIGLHGNRTASIQSHDSSLSLNISVKDDDHEEEPCRNLI